MKTLADRGFAKKKPDTNRDTHGIKIGVRLCQEVAKKMPPQNSDVDLNREEHFAVKYSAYAECEILSFRHCEI